MAANLIYAGGETGGDTRFAIEMNGRDFPIEAGNGASFHDRTPDGAAASRERTFYLRSPVRLTNGYGALILYYYNKSGLTRGESVFDRIVQTAGSATQNK